MKLKHRLVISLSALIVFSLAGLLVGLQVTVTPLCGCAPLDMDVGTSLDQLDALIHQYAAEHDGLYPTYDTLMAIAEQNDNETLNTNIRLRVVEYYKEKGNLTFEELNLVQSYMNHLVSSEELTKFLNGERVNALVRQYQLEHRDFPSYDDWVRQAELENDHRRLTSQVDLRTRDFIVRPTHMGAVGYAVSPDQHDYVLLGAGWGEMRASFYGIGDFTIGDGPRILRPVSSDMEKRLATQFSIYANQGWQDTGIVVHKGYQVSIEYISGLWFTAVADGGGHDASGAPNPWVCALPDCHEPLHDFPKYALIGRIGNSKTVLKVGNNLNFVAESSGILYLRPNYGDVDLITHHPEGEIIVKISRR